MRLCESAGTGLAPDLGRWEAESAGEGHACGVPHNGGSVGGSAGMGLAPDLRRQGRRECWGGAHLWCSP